MRDACESSESKSRFELLLKKFFESKEGEEMKWC